MAGVDEGAYEVLGGMITAKTIKYTKTGKVMCFLTLEDMVGTVEVVVFPQGYEEYVTKLLADEKVFIRGRVNAEEEKNAKLILDELLTFEEAASGRQFKRGAKSSFKSRGNYEPRSPKPQAIPQKGLFLQFETPEAYAACEKELLEALADSDGEDDVVIFVKSTKQVKVLPANLRVRADEALVAKLSALYGEENVKVR